MSDNSEEPNPLLTAVMRGDPSLTALGEAGLLGENARTAANQVRKEQAAGLVILFWICLALGVVWGVYYLVRYGL